MGQKIFTGESFAAIAKREGRGERQLQLMMPLAFMAPQTVRQLIDETSNVTGIPELAKNVPLLWARTAHMGNAS